MKKDERVYGDESNELNVYERNSRALTIELVTLCEMKGNKS